jgi:hypothetical protein
MIAKHRQRFNAEFTPQKYQDFLRALNARCRTQIHFRVCETPAFFPESLINTMADYGNDLMQQLLGDPEYMRESERSVPPRWNVPNQDATPLFVSVDFGLVRDADGNIQPKLVELQAFPTLYAYQAILGQQYKDSFGLDSKLKILCGDFDLNSYRELLKRVIVGEHASESVVLLEIDPEEQKTVPDFRVTEEWLNIPTVNIRDVVKRGNRLHYSKAGKLVPIERVYNRTIVDELERKRVKLPFDYRDNLDVEWAGLPNWYFRISKFSIPFLKHQCVPKTWFLDQLTTIPKDRDNYLLKPLYSFAGSGIVFGPTDEQLNAIPQNQRHNYILQERMSFAPVIDTPHGGTQAEARMMYIWPEGEHMTPVMALVRMGRGKMMGVDHNKNLEWVGGSAALIDPAL